MRKWSKVTIEEVTSVLGDGLHGTPKYSENGEYAFINGNNLVNGKIVIKKDTKKVDETQYEKYRKPLSERTLMVSINGTLGNVGEYNGEKVILGKSACYFNVIETVNKNYIKYVISSPYFKDYLERNANGTTIKNISLKQMREYEFLLPPRQIQDKISEILGAIDRQIEVNEKINNNLTEQMATIFINVRDSSVWPEQKIENIMCFYDHMRKPLSSRQRDGKERNYPYYGATSIVDYVENYIFDGIYILISEDGANVVDKVGHPLIQYAYGKFWANNHAHIVQGTNGFSEALLFALLRTLNIQSIVTGAAQPKVNQANLRNFTSFLPKPDEAEQLSAVLEPFFNQMIINDKENALLTELRDTLLPKLMSGELDVSKFDL